MQHLKSEVVTVNIGQAASMASFLLCAGSRGRRLALPHSRIMIHQPMGGMQGQAEDIRVEASQIMRIKNNIVRMYSMMTGQPSDRILNDIDRYKYYYYYDYHVYLLFSLQCDDGIYYIFQRLLHVSARGIVVWDH